MKNMIYKHNMKFNRVVLITLNILLMSIVLFSVVSYSNKASEKQNEMRLESFCNTVESMKSISSRYLAQELDVAKSWVSYIEQENMTMDQAIDYINTISDAKECEAHFVDVDTYDAYSTRVTNGSNHIGIYQEWKNSTYSGYKEYARRLKAIFDGEKYVLGKYKIYETQRTAISVGDKVSLKTDDGQTKDYLLLRVVPINRLKELWIFPSGYKKAEIGLIDTNYGYVIQSKSMRSGNFKEFIRFYNFYNDFNGVDEALEPIKYGDNGILILKDSRYEDCYWYYSRLSDFKEIDVVGYIPVSEIENIATNVNVIIGVSIALLSIGILDGVYFYFVNKSLKKAVEIAENANKTKTRFLSSMSHDIRTPLNAILGMTKLAQDNIKDGNYVDNCLNKISLSGKHLLTLINDILEITRIESDKINITPTIFKLQDLAKEIQDIIEIQALEKDISFSIEIDDEVSPCLYGDKLRLTQIYINLLNNAVKYTDVGGNVSFKLYEEKIDDEQVRLTGLIKDNGVGMSNDFQAIMYESFSRVNDNRIDKIQGTGLGLSIVKRLVDYMKGTIECDSTLGEGTEFIVSIPLMMAEENLQEDGVYSDIHSITPDKLDGLHILVAEDNDINWEVVSALLGEYHIICTRAENGQECVEELLKQEPGTYDLVFMDVQMPILNGVEACKKIRSLDRKDLKEIPIVAMSADAFVEDIQMCLEAGMNDHLAKPIEIDKVLATIRRVLKIGE